MLNAPPGRFTLLARAERLDPYTTWQYRHHTVDGIRLVPAVIGKM
jgi:hypothetical protein